MKINSVKKFVRLTLCLVCILFLGSCSNSFSYSAGNEDLTEAEPEVVYAGIGAQDQNNLSELAEILGNAKFFIKRYDLNTGEGQTFRYMKTHSEENPLECLKNGSLKTHLLVFSESDSEEYKYVSYRVNFTEDDFKIERDPFTKNDDMFRLNCLLTSMNTSLFLPEDADVINVYYVESYAYFSCVYESARGNYVLICDREYEVFHDENGEYKDHLFDSYPTLYLFPLDEFLNIYDTYITDLKEYVKENGILFGYHEGMFRPGARCVPDISKYAVEPRSDLESYLKSKYPQCY